LRLCFFQYETAGYYTRFLIEKSLQSRDATYSSLPLSASYTLIYWPPVKLTAATMRLPSGVQLIDWGKSLGLNKRVYKNLVPVTPAPPIMTF
jgi:hypothetical protein